uniref:Uncharacterized protein n=1 Tax=Timema genevievae TaxID=629358 RepID=A0A7R9JSH0_TIMGE|nr:unnamed protein product [Timema genevievae]
MHEFNQLLQVMSYSCNQALEHQTIVDYEPLLETKGVFTNNYHGNGTWTSSDHDAREAKEATIHPTQTLIQTFDRQAVRRRFKIPFAHNEEICDNQEDKNFEIDLQRQCSRCMYSQVVFLMVLMVTMALIEGAWSAPQNRPQISIDDIVSIARAILSRIASSGI